MFFLRIRRPPRSTRPDHSLPTRRSSDLMGAEVHRLPQKIVSSVGETYGCPTGHPVKKIKENSLICRNRGEVFAAAARRKFPAIITIRERQYIKATGRRGFEPPIK